MLDLLWLISFTPFIPSLLDPYCVWNVSLKDGWLDPLTSQRFSDLYCYIIILASIPQYKWHVCKECLKKTRYYGLLYNLHYISGMLCWVRPVTFVNQVKPVSFYFTTFLGGGGAGYVCWQCRICVVVVQDMCGGGTGYVVEKLEIRLAFHFWLRDWQFGI